MSEASKWQRKAAAQAEVIKAQAEKIQSLEDGRALLLHDLKAAEARLREARDLIARVHDAAENGVKGNVSPIGTVLHVSLEAFLRSTPADTRCEDVTARTGRITVEELEGMFGDRIPIAAVSLLTAEGRTVDEVRSDLAALTKRGQTEPAADGTDWSCVNNREE